MPVRVLCCVGVIFCGVRLAAFVCFLVGVFFGCVIMSPSVTGCGVCSGGVMY